MKKKLVGMLATATLLTMALAGNVQAAEIRSVGPDGEAAVDASTIELTDDQIAKKADIQLQSVCTMAETTGQLLSRRDWKILLENLVLKLWL